MTYHQQKYDRIKNRMRANQRLLSMVDNFSRIIEDAGATDDVEMQIYSESNHRDAKIQVEAHLKSGEAVEAIGRVLEDDNVEQEAFYDSTDYPVMWAVWRADQ